MRETMHKLMECIKTEIDKGLGLVNADDLGKAVDMVKDLSESIYNISVADAMENGIISPDKPLVYNRMGYSEGYSDGFKEMAENSLEMLRNKYHETKDMKDLEKYLDMVTEEISELKTDISPEHQHFMRTRINNVLN